MKKSTWLTLAVLGMMVAATAADANACFRRCGGRRRCCGNTYVSTCRTC